MLPAVAGVGGGCPLPVRAAPSGRSPFPESFCAAAALENSPWPTASGRCSALLSREDGSLQAAPGSWGLAGDAVLGWLVPGVGRGDGQQPPPGKGSHAEMSPLGPSGERDGSLQNSRGKRESIPPRLR